jgi:hypothetical protein
VGVGGIFPSLTLILLVAHAREFVLQSNIWKQFVTALAYCDTEDAALEVLRVMAKYGVCFSSTLYFSYSDILFFRQYQKSHDQFHRTCQYLSLYASES